MNLPTNHIRENAPPLGSHVFQANVSIFELIQDIIETNLLTKFHEDWTRNVASIVKNAPPTGGHPFKEKCPDIIGIIILIKFHEDRTINVDPRVLTTKNKPCPWWPFSDYKLQTTVPTLILT
ncbi:hypothetical protein DPMN_105073 [Dreissena polymorpha]|uniref:Uncharacterized protein n=1 Tax=Dreissena polymorpha TaxID=45954 RepID=A0A9D4K2Z5_DREPO|nr:hypothetical protein DPMN_105073 [Dreissena polymorpha]